MLKSNVIRLMEDAVRKASRGLIRDYGELEHLQVSRKGVGDFVTSADLRAEDQLIYELQKVRPKFGILSEEREEIPSQDGVHRFIIDPLDGTKNFMHGIPYFCITVALEKKQPNGKKEIVAGVTFAPILNELFWAEKGEGAYLNDRRIAVSQRKQFEEGLFVSYPWHGRRDSNAAECACRELANKTGNIRSLGSSALELAYVAAGRIDGFWHDSLKPWDMAAGVLLVKEARGLVSEIQGGSEMLAKGNILATNETMGTQVRSTLSRYYG